MIEYRPFRNTDPPALCHIWRKHAPLRARYQPLTPSTLENTVLSKPFFDRQGLIVATENGQPIGFVHAGFAPNAAGNALDTSTGATCMLMVGHHAHREQVTGELLARSESFLSSRGASLLYAGSIAPIAPFYLGLYGGCALPGILSSDQPMLDFYRVSGYVQSNLRLILQRQLVGFRPVVDRLQIQIRRGSLVEPFPDPPPANWWEASTEALTERFWFAAMPRSGGETLAKAVFWDMEPLASSWGVHARGLAHIEVISSTDRDAIATFLLAESLRMMALDGVTLVETHVSADDPLVAVCQRLGFEVVEEAVELRKIVPSPVHAELT
jgi:hypothetical protein